MPLVFGTDGVRGRANDELTPEVAVAFGRAVVRTLGDATLLVGRDTRRSSPMLAAAVCAGAAAEGANVEDLGVIPTAGVAAHCVRHGDPGVVVSASHNPYGDNGLKVLAGSGRKLDPSVEAAIEAAFASARLEVPPARPGRDVGVVRAVEDARAWYASRLLTAAGDGSLSGVRVVVDCANGAASGLAADVFAALGAAVSAIGDDPDGCNINDKVGSTSPQSLADAVVAAGADLGVALDGDADRCIAVDANGRVLDGDWLLALFATHRRRAGTLGGGVVVTVMSNLGLHHALRDAGIEVVEVPVGDRHVAEALARTGWILGGEQSGHVVFADRATTGDGVLTGLLLAQLVASHGPLASLTEGLLSPVPQVLVNVEVADVAALESAASVWSDVAAAQRELGDRGRVLVRASGTESLVRLMVEAEDEAALQRVVDVLRTSVVDALGAPTGPG
ncbi:MAG TPA: phosphoglucosamine mutase [Acidimicrobiales bacterium]|nr:phosphoglucosamine mutase [Acidimicrobiales bacterium]